MEALHALKYMVLIAASAGERKCIMENGKKRALIVGMARSGIAAARLLYENGYEVIVNDMKSEIDGLTEALAGIEYTSALGKAPEGEKIIRLKPEKDVTDTYAAVSEGIKCGYSRFNIYGASGGRIEHTLANIQLIASLAEKNMQASIFDGSTVITAITAKTLRFDSAYNGYISIFAHSDKCTGVCLRGLKYPLENAELNNLFPLGVSNEFLGVESEIVIGNGTAIIVYSLPKS